MSVPAASGSMDNAADSLLEFLTEGGDAPEVLWEAALAIIERAVAEAREARFGRFRYNPAGQLRRLVEEMARGERLAGLARAMVEAENERHRAREPAEQ